MNQYVFAQKAEEFIPLLEDKSVHLICIDPPYYGIVPEEWDNSWPSVSAFADWLTGICTLAFPKLTEDGSLVMFGALGKHGERPLFETMNRIEKGGQYTYRNMITWKKRRAYGKSHDYLFCREEIVWYSASAERTKVRFNIPYLDEKRGYAGFNPDYPAKSEYKRVSNVWDDIPELMRPERTCQKPIPLLKRIVDTHSNPGDYVVDFFAGMGTTGLASIESGRLFYGCDSDEKAAALADVKIVEAVNSRKQK